MSPARPKVSRSAPGASKKATTIHWTWDTLASKALEMVGSEMLTMLAFRVDMKVPKETTESTSHLWPPPRGSVSAVVRCSGELSNLFVSCFTSALRGQEQT